MHNNKRIGLALSGGGYRAAAFHIGTIRALHNMGILDKVDVISSVSGGAITAACYALNKDNFAEFDKSLYKKLQRGVLCYTIAYVALVCIILAAIPVLSYYYLGSLAAVISITVMLILITTFFYKVFPVSKIIECEYNHHFFNKQQLKDLPSMPKLSINATDMATANQFYFAKEYVGSFRYRYDSFNASTFPVAKAVMASSCVPFAFSPIRIPNEFITSVFDSKEKPLLIDGGLYDNQGTHCLTDSYSKSECDYIIASVAGNTSIKNAWTINPFMALWKTSNVLMKRIENIQIRENLYLHLYPNKRFAYIKLEWDCTETLLKGFVDNVLKGNVYEEVLKAHNIPDDLVLSLKNHDTSDAARAEIMQILKSNIKWEAFEAVKPTASEHALAYAVGTNLIGLSKKKLNALIKCSEWMSNIQIRLYLPQLLS